MIIILLNRATKLSGFFLKMDKIYVAKVLLGVTTETWDSEGRITSNACTNSISETDFIKAAEGLKGEFYQQPPVYSAKKISGKPAYYYARNKKIDMGKIILQKNMVRIHYIATESFCAGKAVLKITCSSGTYIRAIVHEIGQGLDAGQFLQASTEQESANLILRTA